jgi:arylsulfatase
MLRLPLLFCAALTFGFLVLAYLPAKPLAADPPNFLIFFTDDLGYGDLSCYGAPRIETPNLDRMAAEGTRFTSFYVQPVCGVSRAALMTGCYPIRVAEVGNTKAGHPVLHSKEITLAEVLKTQGYTTGLIGKWHLAGGRKEAYEESLMPTGQGFDHFFGTPLHNGFTREVDPRSFRTQIMRGMEILDDFVDQDEMDQLTRRYTEAAVRFIEENRDHPFFLYLAHNMPHVPIGASDAFRGTSQGGTYGDTIEELDWSMGRVLGTLKEADIDEKTLVVFTSDNGPWIEAHLAAPDGSDPYYGSAGPLRGCKMTTWEGGVRVPCIMRWPGRVPAGRVCDEMITSMDILPTFAHLADAPIPSVGDRRCPTESTGDRTIDGRNVWPVLSGEPGAQNPRTTFYYYCYNHLQAVRHGRWKLVLPRRAKPPWCSWSARMVDAVRDVALFDLETDIGETTNVAGEHPGVVAELTEWIEEARRDLGDYNRVGQGARFFDEGPRRPDAAKWEGVDSMGRPVAMDGGGPYPRSFTFSTAIPPEEGVTRRDPSDVLLVGETFYVWYSKVTDTAKVWGYPSGYSADVWYATSPDGKTWSEQGQAVGKGGPRAWDEHGVFTPNILAAEGKYVLFYTGVPVPFDAKTKTAIGVAVADSPEGPWKKLDANPVLRPSDNQDAFDSMRVDDAALIHRHGRYWLYYKGRQLNHSPGETKMGVAVAEHPEGPYKKHPAGSLHPGHEVLVWPHGEGVASMATAAGPRRIYFAPDGLHFAPRNEIANSPRAPGGFRADGFDDAEPAEGLTWGISHAREGKDLYLVRFDCVMTGAAAAGRRARYRPPAYDHAPPVGPLRFDFESGDLQGWRVVEGRFDLILSDRKSLPRWTDVPFNKQGKYHLSTVATEEGATDKMTGVVESPRFRLEGDRISFLAGGGDDDRTYVALCTADGVEVLRTGGPKGPYFRRVRWDVSPWKGQVVFLRLVDRKTAGWGHITFDDFSTAGTIVDTAEHE